MFDEEDFDAADFEAAATFTASVAPATVDLEIAAGAASGDFTAASAAPTIEWSE